MEAVMVLFTGIGIFFAGLGVLLAGVAALKWAQIQERNDKT